MLHGGFFLRKKALNGFDSLATDWRTALSRTGWLLCYTSRVKSYAEPVQDEAVWLGRVLRQSPFILSKLRQLPRIYPRPVRAGFRGNRF